MRLNFSSRSLQKSNFDTSSNAVVGASLPPCHTVSWHFSSAFISSSRETILRSFCEAPFLNLYFGALPYFFGISAITFLSLSLGLKPATSKAVRVLPAITEAYLALKLFAFPKACSIACLNSASVMPSFLHSITRNYTTLLS